MKLGDLPEGPFSSDWYDFIPFVISDVIEAELSFAVRPTLLIDSAVAL
jgi:hypothetical protein